MASGTNTKASTALSSFFQGVNAEDEDQLTTSRGIMPHLALPLLAQMGLTPTNKRPLAFLDLACGTGVLTQEIQGMLSNDVLRQSTFKAGDLSDGMVKFMKKRVQSEDWVNVEVNVMDAQNTRLPNNSLSHVGISLGLHLISDADAVIKDSMRILRPGGTFGAITFASTNMLQWWCPDIRTAFASLPFNAPFRPIPMQLHDQGHWDDSSWITTHLRALGLQDVEVHEVPGTYFLEGGADEFLTIFGGTLGWVMKANWDEKTREEHPAEEVRHLVREHLKEKYSGKGWNITWTTIIMSGRVL